MVEIFGTLCTAMHVDFYGGADKLPALIDISNAGSRTRLVAAAVGETFILMTPHFYPF